MAETRYYRVRGVVQGVGFRAATRDRARALELAGHVRNRADGDVELVAQGPAEALDELGRWLADGPAMARVDDVQAERVGTTPAEKELAMPFAVA